jgi:hypothetical protein
MDNKNQPAFPVLELKQLGDKMLLDCATMGLTKREYFAAKAMQGLMATDYVGTYEMFAERAVNMSDALIAELSKP